MPELAAVPHRAPHDLAQHVAAPFVRRHDAVGDEERRRARVIGDDAHRDVGRRHRLVVGVTRHLADRVEQRHEQRRVVVRRRALHHRADALEAHAGVDRRRRQGSQRALVVALELHEHVVPDLDEALAAGFDVLDEVAGSRQCRRRDRRRSPSSGRTGPCRPSPRSCRPCRARRCDRRARNPASACTPRRRAGCPFRP